MSRVFFSLMQKSIEWISNIFFSGTFVFMFHQVNDNKKEWKDSNLSITKASFNEFIRKLLQNGYKFYSLEQLTECKEKKAIVLTFDDIYADVVENAIPYLVERRIPFSIFVSERFIDREGYISRKQLNMLRNEPLCTIGYHGKRHSLMRNLSSAQARDEVECSELESILHQSMRFFAFPYGSMYACNWRSVQVVKKANYKFAFSTISAPCNSLWINFFGYFLPRININEHNYQRFLRR